ncbi:MAG: transposase family protein, partial [Mesoflavibacter sp.]|nr:transposase family protein [Mesoflavibacter sp.]
YHTNAKTNSHSRAIIQNSSMNNIQLSQQMHVGVKTISKWRKRKFIEDKISRPKTIYRALSDIERETIRVIRTLTWLELDDLTDSVLPLMPKANRSNVYRTLCHFGINQVPHEKKQQAKKFKEYEPGFLHIDVTYLPKLEGKKHYLFVAIDRATRVIYFRVYDRKTASNAEDFLDKCKSFFPFYISHILTDNGLEFTDKFIGKNKEVSGNHKFDKVCIKAHIEHRLTKPASPQTNGMVERANGTIKNATIKAQTYASFDEMLLDLDKFLLFYNFNRSHGGLRKELKVKTPFEALKCWYNLQPVLFKKSPDMFQDMAFKKMEQRSET